MGHAQFAVGIDQYRQGELIGRRVLVVLDGALRAVGRGDIGPAAVIEQRDMRLILGQRVHDVAHALAGVGRVLALRKTGDEFLEALERLLGRSLIALVQLLVGQEGEPALIGVEVDQALKVEHIVGVGVVGVELEKAVGGGQGLRPLALLVVAVGDLDQRLLRQQPVGVARLELLVQLHTLVGVAAVHFVLGLCIQFGRRPAQGFVFRRRGGTACKAQQHDCRRSAQQPQRPETVQRNTHINRPGWCKACRL